MMTLIQRNLRLYFNNLSGVFFSLMGALISFGLYLLFLRQNMLSSWAQVPDTKLLLDLWLIGGTLTVTAVTTTANGLGQMIRDRETGALADLTMTDVSFTGIQLSYLISAMIIGIVMQLIMLVAMVGYFGLMDQVRFSLDLVVPLFGIVLLSSLVWTSFNLLVLSFITNVDSLGKVGTILGTSAGFFAGVYLPIGSVPTVAQKLMKLTPAPYNAALYRKLLMQTQLETSFQKIPREVLQQFKIQMGIELQRRQLTSNLQNSLILLAFSLGFIGLTLILAKISRRLVVSRV